MRKINDKYYGKIFYKYRSTSDIFYHLLIKRGWSRYL